ncbi:hypothetical protein C6361_31165 [Plantactinospora sp. BC1]|uniref:hypothetical protein n=1 Tax=Plantactinospora sp. BC1 TaxID=2108470 RepID=UPI000D157800|nr:hypothetical protein [Plantactinospora sp. BC1]AVT33165.1 hypothetical protein C6361_31165 [Plantactinospora sp. BC1]
MANLLDRIDRAMSGLCPCGAAPADGSAYCSDDCRPSHVGDDTDTRESGHLATPMRWRPDLVTAGDDDDLVGPRTETWYEGPYRAQIFERASRPGSWHLRLDDGHRYVDRDLDDPVEIRSGPVPEQVVGRIREIWRRLERELGDPRRATPYAGPWQAAFPGRAGASPVPRAIGPARLGGTPSQPWQRLCRRCDRHGVPLDGRRDGAPCHLCPHCRTPFPGPVLIPTLQSHGRHTVLKLSYVANGEYFTRSAFVSGRDMMTAEDPAELLQSAWDRLETFLLDQIPRSRTGHGRLDEVPAAPGDPAAG